MIKEFSNVDDNIYEEFHAATETDVVNFDPNKDNQIFFGKEVSVNYENYGEGWSSYWSLSSYWYYPATTLTYISATTLNLTFSYQYYPSDYYTPSAPDVVNAPEWHNLFYAEKGGLTPPVTYTADYSQLIRLDTVYMVPMTPTVSANISQVAWTTLFLHYSWEICHRVDAPITRTEWLSPGIFYDILYYRNEDPYWTYYARFKEDTPAEGAWAFGAHPLNAHLYLRKEETGSVSLYTTLFMDAWFKHLKECDYGHIKLYYEGEEWIDEDVNDGVWINWIPDYGRYYFIMDAYSSQPLSPELHAEFSFTITSGTEDYKPPMITIHFPSMNDDCTHPPGEIWGLLYVFDESPITSASLEYSTDDGATWKEATLTLVEEHEAEEGYTVYIYEFTIPELRGCYLTLRTTAVDEAENSITQTVKRGIYITWGKLYLFAGEPADIPPSPLRIWYRSMDTEETWSSWKLAAGPWVDCLRTIVYNDRLYLFASEPAGPTDRVWYRSMDASGSWSSWKLVAGAWVENFQPIVYNDRLYLFAREDSGCIWYRSMDADETWSSWKIVAGTWTLDFQLIVYNDRLYLFARDWDGSIWYRSMDASGTWSSWKLAAGPWTCLPFQLIVYNDRLYLFAGEYCEGVEAYRVWYRSMDAGGTWSGWKLAAGAWVDYIYRTIVYNNRLYFFASEENGRIWYRSMDTSETWTNWKIAAGSWAGNFQPIVYNNRLYFFVSESAGSYYKVWCRSMDTSGTWSSWKLVAGAWVSRFQPIVY